MQPCLGINMCHISKLFNCPTKKRIITGIKPRSPTDSVFKELKLLKCTDINKYLVDRLMYRVYNNDYQLFQAMFVMNKHVHSHSTRQSDHYHVPLFKTRLGKSGLRFNGATVWNKILQLGFANETHEAAFAKYLKSSILYCKLYLVTYNLLIIIPEAQCSSVMSLMDWYWRYNSHAPSHQYENTELIQLSCNFCTPK